MLRPSIINDPSHGTLRYLLVRTKLRRLTRNRDDVRGSCHVFANLSLEVYANSGIVEIQGTTGRRKTPVAISHLGSHIGESI